MPNISNATIAADCSAFLLLLALKRTLCILRLSYLSPFLICFLSPCFPPSLYLSLTKD